MRPADADDDDDDDDEDEAFTPEQPELRDELDLHTFQPRDCADVVDEYLRAAQEAGFATVRIIHGKGTGTLRRIVQGVLDRHTSVAGYAQADANWGATRVELKPR
jgi:dsDNA-specific endonuclease/ATPase MutS2